MRCIFYYNSGRSVQILYARKRTFSQMLLLKIRECSDCWCRYHQLLLYTYINLLDVHSSLRAKFENCLPVRVIDFLTLYFFNFQGALSFPNTFHLAGEIHPKAVERAKENVQHVIKESSRSPLIDVLSWDATRLPLRDSSVDVFVTDLVS